MPESERSGRKPPSVRGMWTVSHGDVLIGAFKTHAEMDEWLERIGTPESVIRVSRDQVTVAKP